MKRIFFMVIPAILLASLVLFGLSDTMISVARTGTPDSEVVTATNTASNCSGTATITITMTGVSNE